MGAITNCQELIGKPLPWFQRDSSRGRISVGDGSGRTPWILVFCPRPEVPGGQEYLRALAAERDDCDRLGARLLVLSIVGFTADFPLAVVADAADLYARFGFLEAQGNAHCGLLVADRYGQVDCCYSGDDFSTLPPPRLLLRRLEGAESVCPECGVPEARWLEIA